MSPATKGLVASAAVRSSAQHAALSEYLSSSSTSPTSLDAAVEKFAEPIETTAIAAATTTKESEDLEETLNTAWKSIIAHAADTPFTDAGSDKLVEFVWELSARPDVEAAEEKSSAGSEAAAAAAAPVKVQEMTLWKDLPTFGWQLRDAWNFAAQDTDDEDTQQRWTNLNAWTASLVAAGNESADKSEDKTPPSLDFSLYGIWTIRSALEQEKGTTPSAAALSAAAVWFIFAAKDLHAWSKADKTFDGKFAAPGPAFGDKEWRGYCSERWQVWTDALREASQNGKQDDDGTKQLVQRAVEAVEKVM